MSSPAERLAAAKAELESHFSSAEAHLAKRSSLGSTSPSERIAAAREQFNAAFNGLAKRSQSSAAERLAAAKEEFASHFSSMAKRDGLSPADRLAAAKEEFASHVLNVEKRELLSPAERLAAAKQQLENGFTGAASALVKRADDKNAPVQGDPEMPVSNFQKTVVPIVIGLVLLAIFGAVAGFIVYKRRQKNKAKETAQHRRKHLDLEDDGADEDYGYELPQSQRVQDVGFNGTGASIDTGRKRTGSLNGAESQPKRDEPRELNSKEFV